MKYLFTVRNLSYLTSLTIALGIVGFILLQNLAPLGITMKYNLQEKSKYISALGPKDRVKELTHDGETIYNQISDITYFSTDIPFHFDAATILMRIKNENPEQLVKIGYKDQEDWHYATKTVDLPLLTLPEWNTIEEDVVLYQREKKYSSIKDFYKNPPQEAIVGVYNYDTSMLFNKTLNNYSPQEKETVIHVPFRGKITLYAYLQNEPFSMTVTKQDMNWYKDADPAFIDVLKDETKVFSTQIDDDGIKDSSRRTSSPQSVTIKNPGPGLPETGIYKIIINASQDSLVKEIRTNLHKVVFESPVYLAGNASIYKNVIKKTEPTKFYTNALLLNILTYHPQGLQRITTTKKILQLTAVNKEGQIIPEQDITPVNVPKNDVIIQSFAGYIAFDQKQFFLPTKYRLLPITEEADLNLVDYVLTDKKPEQQAGDWRIVKQTFDLSNAIIDNNKLSWIIQAPKLRDSNNTITIGDIQVTFHKKPATFF